jgi:hypothetical protein
VLSTNGEKGVLLFLRGKGPGVTAPGPYIPLPNRISRSGDGDSLIGAPPLKKVNPDKGNAQGVAWSPRDTRVLVAIVLVSAGIGVYFGIASGIAAFVALSGAFLPKSPTLKSWSYRRNSRR